MLKKVSSLLLAATLLVGGLSSCIDSDIRNEAASTAAVSASVTTNGIASSAIPQNTSTISDTSATAVPAFTVSGLDGIIGLPSQVAAKAEIQDKIHGYTAEITDRSTIDWIFGIFSYYDFYKDTSDDDSTAFVYDVKLYDSLDRLIADLVVCPTYLVCFDGHWYKSTREIAGMDNLGDLAEAANNPVVTDSCKIDTYGLISVSFDGGASYVQSPARTDITNVCGDYYLTDCKVYCDADVACIAIYISNGQTGEHTGCGTILYTSTDQGKTWDISSTVDERPYDGVFLYFTSATDGWYGFTYGSVANQGLNQVYRTTDGGITWQRVVDRGSGFVAGAGSIDDSTCFISYVMSGAEGGPNVPAVDATFDGGATWQSLTLTLPAQYDSYCSVGLAPIYKDGELLYPVALLANWNSTVFWVAGNYTDGMVYFKSTDGGHTWTLKE